MKGLTARQPAAIAVADDRVLHAALHRFVQGQLRDRTDSEDLVQETFVRLYTYRSTRAVQDAGAFCFAVARNLVTDHLRRRRAGPATGEICDRIACPQPRIDERLIHRQRVAVLAAALDAMPPLRREVFLRRRLDGDSAMTVATDLDLSLAAVEKHVTRALADLRAALDRRRLWIGDPA